MKHCHLVALLGTVLLGAGGCAGKSNSPVVINEVMPSNSTTACMDELFERNDWVELYNKGKTAIDLGGYSITDDTANPRKSVFPEGLTIDAGGVLLLWADGSPEQGKAHLSFKLNSKLEAVTLYDPEELQIDRAAWDTVASDVSWARVPDGTGKFAFCSPATCGAINGSSCGN